MRRYYLLLIRRFNIFLMVFNLDSRTSVKSELSNRKHIKTFSGKHIEKVKEVAVIMSFNLSVW